MTDLVLAVTIGFLFTRFIGFVTGTVNKFVENDKTRTNKVDKQLAEVNERMDKMHRELSAVMAFVTRSTSSGKGNYRTTSGLAGDLACKIDESLKKMTENDLKRYELLDKKIPGGYDKYLFLQNVLEQVGAKELEKKEESKTDEEVIIVDKSKELDELFELLNK